jgi:uncharacterized protein YciI
MRWIAIFTDTPDMLAIRAERGDLHLAYLRAHTDEILIAGGCREGPDQPFVGGLWVMEVPSRERAVELVEHDPYWVPAHRSVRLLTWGKGLPELAVTL